MLGGPRTSIHEKGSGFLTNCPLCGADTSAGEPGGLIRFHRAAEAISSSSGRNASLKKTSRPCDHFCRGFPRSGTKVGIDAKPGRSEGARQPEQCLRFVIVDRLLLLLLARYQVGVGEFPPDPHPYIVGPGTHIRPHTNHRQSRLWVGGALGGGRER